MITTIFPQIYPFISNEDTYAHFTTIGNFSSMEKIMLLDDNDEPIKELNSDDFILSKGFSGFDTEYDMRKSYSLYYRTDKPIKIFYTYMNTNKQYLQYPSLDNVPNVMKSSTSNKHQRCRELVAKKMEEFEKRRIEKYKDID